MPGHTGMNDEKCYTSACLVLHLVIYALLNYYVMESKLDILKRLC